MAQRDRFEARVDTDKVTRAQGNKIEDSVRHTNDLVSAHMYPYVRRIYKILHSARRLLYVIVLLNVLVIAILLYQFEI